MKTKIFANPRKDSFLDKAVIEDNDGAVSLMPGSGSNFEPHKVRYQKGPYLVTSQPGHHFWASSLEPKKYAPATWYLLKQMEDGEGFLEVAVCEPGKHWRKALENLTKLTERLAAEGTVDIPSLEGDWFGELVYIDVDKTAKVVQEMHEDIPPVQRIVRDFTAVFAFHMRVETSGTEAEEDLMLQVAKVAKKRVWRGEIDATVIPQQALDGAFKRYSIRFQEDEVVDVGRPRHGYAVVSHGGMDGEIPHFYAFEDTISYAREERGENLYDEAVKRSRSFTEPLRPLGPEGIYNLDYVVYPLLPEMQVMLPWEGMLEQIHDSCKEDSLRDKVKASYAKYQALAVSYADDVRMMMSGTDGAQLVGVTETDLQAQHDHWQKLANELEAYRTEHSDL